MGHLISYATIVESAIAYFVLYYPAFPIPTSETIAIQMMS